MLGKIHQDVKTFYLAVECLNSRMYLLNIQLPRVTNFDEYVRERYARSQKDKLRL